MNPGQSKEAERALRSWFQLAIAEHPRETVVDWLVASGVHKSRASAHTQISRFKQPGRFHLSREAARAIAQGLGTPVEPLEALFDAAHGVRSLSARGFVGAYSETLPRETRASTRVIVSSHLTSTLADPAYCPTVEQLVVGGAPYDFFILESAQFNHFAFLLRCITNAKALGHQVHATTYLLHQADWPICGDEMVLFDHDDSSCAWAVQSGHVKGPAVDRLADRSEQRGCLDRLVTARHRASRVWLPADFESFMRPSSAVGPSIK